MSASSTSKEESHRPRVSRWQRSKRMDPERKGACAGEEAGEGPALHPRHLFFHRRELRPADGDEAGTCVSRSGPQYNVALIGFDHRTLAEGRKVTLKAILQALELLSLPKGSTINFTVASRGGLVYRTLAEQLLAARPDIKLGQAIFVACTNAGTHLAEPENWIAMIDLYTNVIMAGAR